MTAWRVVVFCFLCTLHSVGVDVHCVLLFLQLVL